MNKSLLLSLAVFAMTATTSFAQIGTGWSTDSAGKNLQKDGNVTYTNSGGVELFRLNSGGNRCEQRFLNNYTSGSHQFQGDIRCSGTPRSSGNSIQQVFATNFGSAATQVRIYPTSNGTLKMSGTTMITGVFGVYERINVIHTRSSGTIDAYVNGSKKASAADKGSDTYYTKYGIYIGDTNQTNPTAEWKNIHLWKK